MPKAIWISKHKLTYNWMWLKFTLYFSKCSCNLLMSVPPSTFELLQSGKSLYYCFSFSLQLWSYCCQECCKNVWFSDSPDCTKSTLFYSQYTCNKGITIAIKEKGSMQTGEYKHLVTRLNGGAKENQQFRNSDPGCVYLASLPNSLSETQLKKKKAISFATKNIK